MTLYSHNPSDFFKYISLDHNLLIYFQKLKLSIAIIMASDIQQRRGHDHQFAEQPPDDLHCIVCLTVAKDPQQMNCCGKMLCKACLDDWSRHSNSGCPQCRVKIVSFEDK